MATDAVLPPKLVQQLFEEHGKNTASWPTELQDLVNPSIQARQLNAPLSGQIEKRLNREYEYFWAKDICGQNPDHSRVEELRYTGFEYATTDDVRMCSEDTVKGRDKNNFSNEIRSGDRRLMKIPMQKWREMRKAQNINAIQMAYPQGFGADGGPMTAANLTPGMKTYLGSEADVDAMRRGAIVSDPTEELATKEIKGNAAVAKIK
jgi:hypothetical protein